MKHTIFGVLLIFFIFSLASAHPNIIIDPGTTPDSLFWGLDKAFDQISLLLIAGDVNKAKKGLEIAEERLAEIKEMIEENKLGDAEKAKEAHSNLLSKVINSVEGIEEDNSEKEIRELIKVEKELQEHEQEVEQTFEELKIKIKVRGELTSEQQVLIDSILASLQGQTREVEIEIKNKKDETKVNIKKETGKSDKEIDDEIEKLEVEGGVADIEIEAEIIGNQANVKIEKEFSTTTVDKDLIIEEIITEFALGREIADIALEIKNEDEEELEEKFKVEVEIEGGIAEVEIKLKFILDSTNREEILNAIIEKSRIEVEDVEGVIEFEDKEDEELKIEVEVENGVAEVKVKFTGEKLEFSLETIDKEMIINEIVVRTGLSEEDVEGSIEFGIEDKDGQEKEESNETEDDN